MLDSMGRAGSRYYDLDWVRSERRRRVMSSTGSGAEVIAQASFQSSLHIQRVGLLDEFAGYALSKLSGGGM